MKISTREKVSISITLVIIFVILYFNLFYKNIHHDIITIKNQIHKNKEDMAAASHYSSQIVELKSKLLELANHSNKIPQVVDTNKVSPHIIVFIEEAIEGLGLGTKVKFLDTQEEVEYNIITIALNFETSYDNIKKIISSIEKSPWPLMMDNIIINKKQSELINSSYDWDVELLLHFIVFPHN